MQFKLLAALVTLVATRIIAAPIDDSIPDTILDDIARILELADEVQAHLSHMITTGEDRPEFSTLVFTGFVDLIEGVRQVNMPPIKNEGGFPLEQQKRICPKAGRFIYVQGTLAHYLEQEAGLITNFGLGKEIGQLIDTYKSEISTFENHLIGRLDFCADRLRKEKCKAEEAMERVRNQYPLP